MVHRSNARKYKFTYFPLRLDCISNGLRLIDKRRIGMCPAVARTARETWGEVVVNCVATKSLDGCSTTIVLCVWNLTMFKKESVGIDGRL